MAKARPAKKRKTAAKPKKTVKAKKPAAKKVQAKKAAKAAKKPVKKPAKKNVVKAKAKPVKKAPVKPAKKARVSAKPVKTASRPSPAPSKPSGTVVIHQGLTGAMPLAVVTHYYDRIGVATLKLMGTMRIGDRIRVTRGETSFEQSVHSLQIAGNPVQGAISGQDVAMKLDQPAHEGARVYKA